MKNIFIILLVVMSLTSCVEVLFEHPQPIGVKEKKQFPKSLQGMYIQDEKDTLLITQFEIQEMSGKQDPDMILSSDLILKKYKGLYYLNVKNENNLWEVGIINVKENGALNVRYIDGNKKDKVERLKQLVKITTFLNDEGEEGYYLINPTKKQLVWLLGNNIFENLGEFRKIK